MFMDVDYERKWNEAISYGAYRLLIDRLFNEGKVTGQGQTDARLRYTALNVRRMDRIDKTYHPSPEAVEAFSRHRDRSFLMTITEGWCGDAAQIVPVIEGIARESGLASRYILRDDHPDLMNRHLTNGSRSIPIVLLLDSRTFAVKDTWGPRPELPQQKMMDHKKAIHPVETYEEVVADIQLWYARDKQQTIERELTRLAIKNAS